MKTCRECNIEMPLSEFYKHQRMKDGHLNKCKTCVKARITLYTDKNPDKRKIWANKYANSKKGKTAVANYLKTDKGKEVRKKRSEQYVKNYPLRTAARTIVAYEISKKTLVRPLFCSTCNEAGKIHAHHVDYTKPLLISWLCEPCHKRWHRENKPIYE